jgi:hypothetical protein
MEASQRATLASAAERDRLGRDAETLSPLSLPMAD